MNSRAQLLEYRNGERRERSGGQIRKAEAQNTRRQAVYGAIVLRIPELFEGDQQAANRRAGKAGSRRHLGDGTAPWAVVERFNDLKATRERENVIGIAALRHNGWAIDRIGFHHLTIGE